MAYVQHRMPCCRAKWEQKNLNKPQEYLGFVKLTLDDNSIIELEGSGELTRNVTELYLGNTVSAEIGNKATSIGSSAFAECVSLTSIEIPNSVTSIGNSAFQNCSSLTSVTIGNSVTSIGRGAFESCSGLTSITIPNSVKSIGKDAFKSCTSLTSVTIGNSVTSIGNYAFKSCTSLKSVTIPNSVKSIGNYAFSGCSGLTSIIVEALTPPSIGNWEFDETNNCPIYVPAESVDAYKAASGWSDYANRIQPIQ